MPEYILKDYANDFDGLVIGSFDTLEEMTNYAEMWEEENSDCILEYLAYCNVLESYLTIQP